MCFGCCGLSTAGQGSERQTFAGCSDSVRGLVGSSSMTDMHHPDRLCSFCEYSAYHCERWRCCRSVCSWAICSAAPWAAGCSECISRLASSFWSRESAATRVSLTSATRAAPFDFSSCSSPPVSRGTRSRVFLSRILCTSFVSLLPHLSRSSAASLS